MMKENLKFSKMVGLLCVFALLITSVYVPFTVSAAGNINSVDIVENETYVFDFSGPAATSAENRAAATGDAAIGYYGWGWSVENGELRANKNNVNQSWSTGGGFRLHTKLADGTYGLYALEPSTRYVVSFKIRVLSSPVTVSGSQKTYKSSIKIGYNSYYNSNSSGQGDSYVNGISTTTKVMESLIDSNMFTLYDADGNGAAYVCGEDWHTVTYFLNTPKSFTNDNALAFYTTNYHGVDTQIDDVSVTKIGADSGVILLKDEYSATDEFFFGKEGEMLNLAEKNIGYRALDPSHTFIGWYKDAEHTQKIDEIAFSKEDKTVYSRWNVPVSITFKNTLDGTEEIVEGLAGEDFEYPADPIDPENKKWFMGWYKDEECTVAHLVTKFGKINETIYSYWKGEIPGISQDFENYTKDEYDILTDSSGQKYKSNRLYFAPTMTKQSEVTYGDSGNAIKYHWNPVQITDKEDHNYYDTSRVTSYDNYFHIGNGLENETLYNVTFKYLAEKADAHFSFYMCTAKSDNGWGYRRIYDTLKNVNLESDGKWHEITVQFTTDFNNSGTDLFFGINNTQNVETVVYFDDINVEAFVQPYESIITINTGINNEVLAIKGTRGEKIEFPELVHDNEGIFDGYYLDKEFTIPYESEVYEILPVTLYAKWLDYSGFMQGFENYTADQWTVMTENKANGTYDDRSDDYTVIYKSNYLAFYTTMSKQSEEVYSGNYAIKFHWNTDPALDKDVSKPDGKNAQNLEAYEHSRYNKDDNVFFVGKGLENNQVYTISFKYKVEKGDQEIQFYTCSAYPGNSWGGRATYNAPEKVQLKKTDGWVEYKFSFATGAIGNYNSVYLGVRLSKHDDVVMYFDDVKVKSLTNSDEVLMLLDTGTNAGIVKHIGKKGEKINLPMITHDDGAKFLGWYVDSAYTMPYEDTVYPQTNVTLYAKWEKIIYIGDLDGDNEITTTDLAVMKLYLAGLSEITEMGALAGDLSGDGKVNTTDLAALKLRLAGIN